MKRAGIIAVGALCVSAACAFAAEIDLAGAWRLEWADNAGISKRYIREEVGLEVEGPAEIVGKNPQETRWSEATVLVRMKERSVPESITVSTTLVRKLKYVRQNGYVMFMPRLLDDGRKIRDAVERQQLNLTFMASEGEGHL